MLYCITTASKEELSSGDLDQFLQSVHHQELKVVLILRGASDLEAERYRACPDIEAVLRIPSGGISVVRNLGLRHLDSLGLDDDDLVSFPDDDCRYPDGLVARIVAEFQRTHADLIVGSYGEQEIVHGDPMPLTLKDATYRSSSVALFVRWSLVRGVGGFNEALGVGSGVFPYGEDNDFALRAFQASSRAYRQEGLRVWHLEERPTIGRNPKGYLTSCALNLRVQGVWLLLARGILSSILQDLRSFPRVFPYLRSCESALHPSKLYRAITQRRLASTMFSGR